MILIAHVLREIYQTSLQASNSDTIWGKGTNEEGRVTNAQPINAFGS